MRLDGFADAAIPVFGKGSLVVRAGGEHTRNASRLFQVPDSVQTLAAGPTVGSHALPPRAHHIPEVACQPHCATAAAIRCSAASRASSLRSAPPAPLDPSSA